VCLINISQLFEIKRYLNKIGGEEMIVSQILIVLKIK